MFRVEDGKKKENANFVHQETTQQACAYVSCMDSSGRCCAVLSLHPRSRQTTVAYTLLTSLFKHLICYHDTLARRSLCARTCHWMVRTLHKFYFASSREGCRSGKVACSSNFKGHYVSTLIACDSSRSRLGSRACEI